MQVELNAHQPTAKSFSAPRAPSPESPAPAAPFETPIDPARVGMDAQRLARVVAAFRAQQAAGVFPGGQLVVRRHGALVVDEAVGIARGLRAEEGEPPMRYTRELRSSVCSAGKPLVAVAIALLEDRGLVD